MKTLNVVGCGKVGRMLARLWADAHVFRIQDVLNRTEESAEGAVRFIGAGRVVTSVEAMAHADVWLVATTDGAIVAVCRRIADARRLRPGDIVFHPSGSLPSSACAFLREQGAALASVHPVKTVPDPQAAVATFAGTYCAMEGDGPALTVLRPAFEAIGGRVFHVDTAHKTIYHAASVFACNYLTALMEVALAAYEKAGIPREQALKVAEPLVRETVENIFRLGPVEALTGPIARGDAATVERQLHALGAWNAGLAELYRRLGEVAVTLAERKGVAGPEALARLQEILRVEGGG
ncbi:MAG: DUF2520 domain-containing protein [Azospira oryzae]|uniref:DUF2520 domain-containing protein n=1 Tax=Pelomicrobium methylotrophicum TaxID=2602750 RepID=A0A5C7ER13_9PROT|nr:Rossmann-like and DUF2520 domain-containing protein [Pelomicrobium methylotrophicum]PZP57537.1 MAG: DUF2520 domain-containing protein [Azospira oryzae]PZP79080.1 MAG: DUF2520 domain-containing protein [Azospira oryzae]TXF10650.1 DUF2520 domain-containing protein [Pelomicrobium methylotrophicum]